MEVVKRHWFRKGKKEKTKIKPMKNQANEEKSEKKGWNEYRNKKI